MSLAETSSPRTKVTTLKARKQANNSGAVRHKYCNQIPEHTEMTLTSLNRNRTYQQASQSEDPLA